MTLGTRWCVCTCTLVDIYGMCECIRRACDIVYTTFLRRAQIKRTRATLYTFWFCFYARYVNATFCLITQSLIRDFRVQCFFFFFFGLSINFLRHVQEKKITLSCVSFLNLLFFGDIKHVRFSTRKHVENLGPLRCSQRSTSPSSKRWNLKVCCVEL